MSAESRVAQCSWGHGDCLSDCLNNKEATKRTNEYPIVYREVVVLRGVNGLAGLAAALESCAIEEALKRDSE